METDLIDLLCRHARPSTLAAIIADIQLVPGATEQGIEDLKLCLQGSVGEEKAAMLIEREEG